MEIFASQSAPPISTTPAANFATSSAGVVDTSGKFTTGDKFAAGVNDALGKLPTVSTSPALICHRCQQHRWQTREQYQAADYLK
jgi:hypothetical protein